MTEFSTSPGLTPGPGVFDPLSRKTVGTDATKHAYRLQAPGLVARISAIGGVTAKGTLEQAFRLPVLLNSVTINGSALHNEYDTLSAGQFSEPPQGGQDAPQLREIPLDTLTMDWEPSWFVVTRQDHRSIRKAIFRILDSKDPVRLLIVRHPHKSGAGAVVSEHVTFRSVTFEDRPGEADTRYVSVDLKQWRSASSERRGHHRPNLPTKHKLTAQDTLRSLSKRYYGTYAHWREIRRANHISDKWGGASPLVKLPGRWKVGAKVTIPAIAKKHSKQDGLHKSVRTDRTHGRHG